MLRPRTGAAPPRIRARLRGGQVVGGKGTQAWGSACACASNWFCAGAKHAGVCCAAARPAGRAKRGRRAGGRAGNRVAAARTCGGVGKAIYAGAPRRARGAPHGPGVCAWASEAPGLKEGAPCRLRARGGGRLQCCIRGTAKRRGRARAIIARARAQGRGRWRRRAAAAASLREGSSSHESSV